MAKDGKNKDSRPWDASLLKTRTQIPLRCLFCGKAIEAEDLTTFHDTGRCLACSMKPAEPRKPVQKG